MRGVVGMDDDGGIASCCPHGPHHRARPCPPGLSRLRGLFDIPGRQVVSQTRLARSSAPRRVGRAILGILATSTSFKATQAHFGFPEAALGLFRPLRWVVLPISHTSLPATTFQGVIEGTGGSAERGLRGGCRGLRLLGFQLQLTIGERVVN
jgi:hypothetical protein